MDLDGRNRLCNGTMEITAGRDWGVAETLDKQSDQRLPMRSNLPTVSPLLPEAATNIADKDYFSVVLAAENAIRPG